MFTKEMMRALEADGEKLRQLTGKDHGPMSYDQWKTTNPRDYEPEPEEEPSELELVYQQLHETQETAKHEAQVAANRIKELEAALEEALEYFKDRYDVRDGSDGVPAPNKEMQMGQMIDEALYGIRF